MYKPQKTHIIVSLVFSLIIAAFGLTGLSISRPDVLAQPEENIYIFPLMFHNATVTAGPALNITPQSGPPGTSITVTGAAFPGNTTVSVGPAVKGSDPVTLENITTAADGSFETDVAIPPEAQLGTTWIVQALTLDGSLIALSPDFFVMERPEEALMILTPGPGSRVTSPLHVAGMADPTFEQNLVVRVIQADGSLVAEAPTTIMADIGRRGPFDIQLPVDLNAEQNIFIQIYTTSARDGGITHLSSVGVTFTPSGPVDIITRSPYPEQIAIYEPGISDTVSGGVAHVEGFGLAGFEQTLLIEVLDQDGAVVGSQPVMVEAPDLGFPGPFSADVPYTVSASGPGRIVVRDISPAFGGNAHLSSVEVNLEP